MMNQKQQLEQHIIEKAMKDEQFRAKLQTSPRETIEQELGVKLPASLRINVLEEKPDSVYLVIPMTTVEHSEEELTEAQLGVVAGGYTSETAEIGCATAGDCAG